MLLNCSITQVMLVTTSGTSPRVSSLDEHRSLTTVQELRRLVQRTRQVVVLSHNKPFLCNVWDATDQTPHAALEVVRDGGGSTIRAWDVNRDMITLHDRRHEILRNYVASAAGADAREVAEALRPVLEAFCQVAYPAEYPPGMMLGPFRGIWEQRVSAANEILNQADIAELRFTEATTEAAVMSRQGTRAFRLIAVIGWSGGYPDVQDGTALHPQQRTARSGN
jgi:hypothetical protein